MVTFRKRTLILCAILFSLPAAAAADCYPARLKCEYLANPIGIDTPQPRFSWEIESHRRGEMQSAYQVLVASSREKLAADQGDKWDSGRVASSQSVNVMYAGAALGTREQYYWKVRVWGSDAAKPATSEVGTFEMGLLKPDDWTAEWIAAAPALPFVAGHADSAIEFDGKSHTLRVPHDPRFKPTDGLTISAWVKPGAGLGKTPRGALSDWREIYRKEDEAGRQLLALGDKSITLGVSVNGRYVERAAPIDYARLQDGQWHLITATFDGRAACIYLDGNQIGRSELAGKLDVGGDIPAFIGSSRGTSEFFDGGIDDLRMYDRALSADDVKQLTHDVEPSTTPTAHWKLDNDLLNAAGGAAAEAIGRASGAPLLRTEVKITKPVRRARAAVCGLGWFELYVNGRKVGDHVLDPVMSRYDMIDYYVTHELEDYLQPGRNAVGVMLGNGWYSQPGMYRYGREPELRCQIDVEYTDGTSESFVSNETWKTNSGPITHNAIQGGETYDARLERLGWATPDYDATNWPAARLIGRPGGAMRSQLLAPMRVVEHFTPVVMTEPQPGVYVFDLGQVFGGWARLHVRGEKGTHVTLKHSERLHPDTGLVDKRNHPEPAQTDTYILKGDPAGETYEPRFTFHPMRFVQVEGLTERPTLLDITGCVVHSDVDLSGGFKSSDPLLNRVVHIIDWTMRSSWYGMPIDCLHREPFPYLEPSETPSHVYARKFMPQFWMKWMRDVISEQRADGALHVVVPNYPRHNSVDVAWTANYPIAVWYLTQYYGDRELLAEHYEAMDRWMNYVAGVAEGNLVLKGTWGDHMSPGPRPGEEDYVSPIAPPPFLWSGYYYRAAVVMSQAAHVLGKKEDERKYAELTEAIKSAVNAKWFDAETSNYAGGAQTCNAFALALDIVPAEKKAAVTASLLRDITETNEGRITTGIIGLESLAEVVGDLPGGGDVFLNVLTRREYPGWGYMIGQGGTTLWESWGQIMPTMKRGREEAMAMFSTVLEFLYSDVAGLHGPTYFTPDVSLGGFENIRIRPQALGELQHAAASIRTVRGMVSSGWRRDGRAFVLDVTVPGNARATVSVPTCGLQNVTVDEGGMPAWRDGKFVDGIDGVTAGRAEPGYVTFNVGSGKYSFRLSGM